MVDFNISEGSPVVMSDVDLVLQQIDILFDTHKGEVYGSEGFGTDYERSLWDLQLSNEAISYQIESDLNSLNLLGFMPKVTTYLYEGTEQDIAMVDIELKRNNEIYNKTYKIS